MRWLQWVCIVLCAVLAALGIYTGQPPYFMFMVVPALVAWSARRARPHVSAASHALRKGDPHEGVVDIEIAQSSDAETFHVTAGSTGSDRWRFEFIPLGWTPTAGPTRATLYKVADLGWPALIEVRDGVMYPRDTPKPVTPRERTAS